MLVYLRINIGQVYRGTLERYPDTLLGDKNQLQKYHVPDRSQYFLERHKLIFSSILYFYQVFTLIYYVLYFLFV